MSEHAHLVQLDWACTPNTALKAYRELEHDTRC
jgi:DNA-binding transcriptional regulator YhcF (GntR family)